MEYVYHEYVHSRQSMDILNKILVTKAERTRKGRKPKPSWKNSVNILFLIWIKILLTFYISSLADDLYLQTYFYEMRDIHTISYMHI